jgi:hypothetical protein
LTVCLSIVLDYLATLVFIMSAKIPFSPPDNRQTLISGCDGNLNNFATYHQCRKRCSRHFNPNKKGKNVQEPKGSGMNEASAGLVRE